MARFSRRRTDVSRQRALATTLDRPRPVVADRPGANVICEGKTMCDLSPDPAAEFIRRCFDALDESDVLGYSLEGGEAERRDDHGDVERVNRHSLLLRTADGDVLITAAAVPPRCGTAGLPADFVDADHDGLG